MQGILASVLEAVGMSMFTMGVLCRNPSNITVWVMNGVFAIPMLLYIKDVIKSGLNREGVKRTVIPLTFALVFEIICIVLTCLMEGSQLGLDKRLAQVSLSCTVTSRCLK